MDKFEGQVASVTGATRGMHRATALRLAAAGAKVVVSARTAARGESAVAEIRGAGGDAALAVGDISDREALRASVTMVTRQFGRLDKVRHCAAESAHGRVVEMDEAAVDHMVHSSVHSLSWLARDTHEALSQSPDGSRLIHISAGSAKCNFIPGLIFFMDTKVYMNAFARGLAMEPCRDRIRVNVVESGMVASDRMREHLSDEVAM